jgi:hypothetical protein
VGNAGEQPQDCVVYDYTGNPYTVKYLIELMGIPPGNIHLAYNAAGSVDVSLVLGAS